MNVWNPELVDYKSIALTRNHHPHNKNT